MFIELFTTEGGLIAVAATLVGLLLPLGFHLFIRRQIRASELALRCASTPASCGLPGHAAAPCVHSPTED